MIDEPEPDTIVMGSLERWGVPLSKAFCDEWLAGLPAPRKVGRRIAWRAVLLKTEVEKAAAEEFSQALHAVAAQFDVAAERWLGPAREARAAGHVITARDGEHRGEPYKECTQLLRRLARKS